VKEEGALSATMREGRGLRFGKDKERWSTFHVERKRPSRLGPRRKRDEDHLIFSLLIKR
jgi:hypothetical protein